MGSLGRILSFYSNSATAQKETVLKTDFYSVRLVKDITHTNPIQDSSVTNILLNGKCVDPETRCLYLFYIDTFFNAAWIIEIAIDTRVQTVVYFDRYNAIGFSPENKIYNARVVYGRIIWTDNVNPIYQIDIKRAKNSFLHGIGYNQNDNIQDWAEDVYYYIGQIVSEYQYFYRCLLNNIGLNPFVYNTQWERLCRIEDAYYSIKIENLYFAPMPPLLPPVVTYEQDDSRKINNLRQTLFQFAYNYVYMDYRESTYSPASIVPMPDGEEEIATGKQTEDISKNNALKITVNTGGEEVRKIKIIGRSSADPSSWFLVEEIDKFSLEEERYESSSTNEVSYLTITITMPLAIIQNSGESTPAYVPLGIAVPAQVSNEDYIYVDVEPWPCVWLYTEFGVAVEESNTFTHTHYGVKMYIRAIPAWMTVRNISLGIPVANNDEIINGTELGFYPTAQNSGAARSATIYLEDDTAQLNVYEIPVSQGSFVAPIAVGVDIDPDETHFYLDEFSGTNTVGETAVLFDFSPWHNAMGEGVAFTVHYRIMKNLINVGTGTINVQNTYNTGTLTRYMSSASVVGDSIEIYVWEEPLD